MGQRTLTVVLALFGVLVIAALALLGYNVYRAAQAGPRWRRRLVGAGLSLLAVFGVLPNASAAEAPAGLVAADSKPLADSPEWKSLDATWREASEVACGKLGPYPFDNAGKKRLLESLATSTKGVDALLARGLLSDAEAGLLRQDLGLLVTGVQSKRPTEMKGATCYAPMRYTPAQDSLKRLTARLPLLEKMAAAEKVQPDVVRKVLGAVQKDLATLADREQGATLPDAERPKASEVSKAAAALVVRLKAALPQPEDPKAR